MTIERKPLLQKLRITGLLVFTLGSTVAVQSQAGINVPQKIDAYGAIACDDFMARLDYFASKLQDEPGALGYIVVYPERNGLAGRYRSYFDLAKDYLVMTRGISPERLTTLSGEFRDRLTTELWLAPKGVTLPAATAPIKTKNHRAWKFDEGFADYSIYEGKPQLWTYDLCGLGAIYFRAFGEQLRAEPHSRGHLIIHIEYGKRSSRARTMAKLLRNEMVKENKVQSHRILIRYGGRRRIPSVELWVVPG